MPSPSVTSAVEAGIGCDPDEWRHVLTSHWRPAPNRRHPRITDRPRSGSDNTVGSEIRSSMRGSPPLRRDRVGPPPRGRPTPVLVDSGKQVLVGRVRAGDEFSWLPVTSENKVVGYIGHRKLHGEVRKLAHLIDDLHQLSLSDMGALEYRMAPLCLGGLVKGYIYNCAGNSNASCHAPSAELHARRVESKFNLSSM